jgi:hypothetical protein
MDFKTLSIIIFQNKREWSTIQNKDKEFIFFIFNRYMAKNYPKQANSFNIKGIDKITAMDVWFQFLRNQVRTPQWFWKGSTKKKEPTIKGWQIIQDFNKDLSINDIYLLSELFPKDIKTEIARLEEILKEQEK